MRPSSNSRGRTRAPAAIAIAIAVFPGACSKGEPESSQSRKPSAAIAPGPVEPAPKAAPEGSVYAPGEALKERLARQEAASKLLVAPPPPPPPPPPSRAPEPPKPAAVAKAPEPAKAAPPKAPVAAAPVAIPAPAPAAPKAEPPKAEAPKTAPTPPPRTEVALAKPAVSAPVTRLLHRVEPEFPREAVKAGAYEGTVQARITLDAGGNVTNVEVIEAKPRRLFDYAVIRALSDWKYTEGASGRTVNIEIAFKAQ